MKAQVLSLEGKETRTIELPEIFSSKIREDIAQKFFEVMKRQQPYSPFFLAGKQYSASGKIRHGRRLWKTAYGKGISRVPRKIFWRRGTQFYWVGASIASARGGKRAHPPKVEHFLAVKRVNKKEKLLAMNSAISSTASPEYVKERYSSLESKKIKNLPFVVESKILKLKTKDFFTALKKVLDDLYEVAIKKESKRAGRGKSRRGNKKSAGLLLVVGKEEEKKIKGIDVKKVSELKISDLYPLGRLTIYTENAIKDLENKENKKSRKLEFSGSLNSKENLR